MRRVLRGCISVALLIGVGVGSADAEGLRDRRDDRIEARRGTTETAVTTPATATPVATPAAGTAGIPAGTRALVKMAASLDSSKHGKGHRFTGILEADIVSGTAVIAARGSQVHGQIVSAQQPRRTVGQSSLGLQITGIMVGTQQRTIESATVKVTSARTGGDTARKVGGAAALGGLADGSDGAEVGVKVGAAASLVSKGQTAAVAAGTVMEFVIGEPGSGVASQVSQEATQPQESSAERVQDRRGDRLRGRR